jgi:hypothetical protein
MIHMLLMLLFMMLMLLFMIAVTAVVCVSYCWLHLFTFAFFAQAASH